MLGYLDAVDVVGVRNRVSIGASIGFTFSDFVVAVMSL
jgi:hypothetical protein